LGDFLFDLPQPLRVRRRAGNRSGIPLDARGEVAQPPREGLPGEWAALEIGGEPFGFALLSSGRPPRLVLAHDPLALAAVHA
jgi:hypothetical protein